MMPELRIRQAAADDTDELSRLLKQLGYDAAGSEIKQALAKNRQVCDSKVYVYELESKQIVGFISTIRFFYFPVLQNITRVTAICVDEQYRNLGIGSQLLSFVEDLAASHGDIVVEVTCAIHRDQAHQFYTHRGYIQHSYKFNKDL